jgi:hypothetical protein
VIAVAKSADFYGELNNHDNPDSMLNEATDGHLVHLLQPLLETRLCKIMFNNYVPFVLTINVLDFILS